MELYQAYADYKDMMNIAEEMYVFITRRSAAQIKSPIRALR